MIKKSISKLQQRKREATRLRQKAENQLKEIRSIERKSSSGLASIDKKIELGQEDSSDVADILTQKTSQLESIDRLIAAAEDRLSREKETIEEVRKVLQAEFEKE